VLNFREVEELAFSFRNLVVIDNLQGLERLTKLQLDNNRITRIENLSHLVRRGVGQAWGGNKRAAHGSQRPVTQSDPM